MAKNTSMNLASALRAARKHLGIQEFRPGQKEVLAAVLAGQDCLGILPTGRGKSLCFQLPTLLSKKVTVIVSPLLSLLQDQEEHLVALGLAVTRIDSTVAAGEKAARIAAVGRGEASFVFTTPEHLERPEVRDALRSCGVGLLVVDEAHCVSQWGHDFRPAYLALRQAIQEIGRPQILALTATATPEVTADILAELGMPAAVVVNTGIYRPNLHLKVELTVSEEAKHAAADKILRSVDGPGLIYVATVREAEALRQRFAELGQLVGVYHGKLRASDREETQRQFMHNELRVVVATKAFGMGIDKPDIRFVVHYNFPDSLESYYQEIGRSGRDGAAAVCTLLYKLEDKRVQAFFLGGKYPTAADAERLFKTLQKSLAEVPRVAAGLRAEDLAKASGISLKRTRVILGWLEAAGVIKRRPKLQVLREFAKEGHLAEFLKAYEARRDSDKERLEAMMHYGQSGACRFRLYGRTSTKPSKRTVGTAITAYSL